MIRKEQPKASSRLAGWRVVTLLFVTALVATACGTDDEGSGTGDTEPPTATEQATDQTDGGGAAEEPTGEPIAIGVSSALTGPGATFAEIQVNGVKTWQEAVNSSGGIEGRPVELQVCDDEGTPEGSSQCARDFQDADVTAVIHLSFTGAVRAAHEVLDGMFVVNTSPNVIPGDDTTFWQAAPPVDETSRAVLDFAAENGIERVGVVAATDASGEAALEAFERVVTDDVELVVERIDPEDIEASGQLADLVNREVGLISMSFSGSGAVSVVRAYSNVGADVPLVLNSANVVESFMDLIEGYQPERLFGAPSVGTLDPEALPEPFRTRVLDYHEQHQEMFGEGPDSLTDAGRYAGDIMGAALQGAGLDAGPEGWSEYLETATVESLTDLTYDPEGQDHVFDGWLLRIFERVGDEWVEAEV